MTLVSRIPSESNPFADRRRWTADDCHRMEAVGILEADRYELIHGRVLERAERTFAHGLAQKRTFFTLHRISEPECGLFNVAIRVGEYDLPEADVLVPKRSYRELMGEKYLDPADLNSIVEVADVTLWRDRNTKMRIYGAAGVPEYWVVDVNGRRLYVYRQPNENGYADVQEYGETQSVAPLAAPDKAVAVADLLP